MDLKQLRHFVALADEGSFSRACKVVAISQPALTRSIKLLEDRLGVVLFERSTRHVAMTDAGELLYERAQLILNEARAAETDVKSVTSRVRPIQLGIAPMFATGLLPRAITAFHASHPDIEIEVTNALFDSLSDNLLQGELDLAFSNLPYTRLDPALVDEPLVDIDVCYLASADHPLAHQNETPFTELTGYPWAVIDEKHANDLYGYIFSSRGEVNSPIRLRTNSLSLLKTLVQSPPWITLLPQHMLREELATGKVCELKVAGEPPVSRPGGLLYRKSRNTDHDIAALAQAIREVCRDGP
jgi:DNA-binding transcriptional LysR family regulator